MTELHLRGQYVSFTRLGRVFGAARVHKLLPLLALIWVAALSRGDPRLSALTSSCAFVLVVTVIGMHLNAITDREVDRVRKPHLAEWTASDPRTLRMVVTAEILASLALLLTSVLYAPLMRLAWWMVLLALFSTTYSFNIFVPGSGTALRGKIHWLSHLITVWGSYFCMWMIGFDCASSGTHGVSSIILVAASLSLVDYGVFIQESANDWQEERQASFRTLPALWGQRRTSLFGLALVAIGACLSWWMIGQTAMTVIGSWALRILVILELAGTLASVAAVRSHAANTPVQSSTERLVDIVFWGARLLPLLLLISGRVL